VVDPIDSTILNTFQTEIFGAALSGVGDFHDVFSFTLDDDYDANSQVSTIDLAGIGVTFGSIFLDGNQFVQSDNVNKYVLDPSVSLLAGLHNIYVNGTIGTGEAGSYSGNLNLVAQAAPGGVPEPATWAMMLLGFGGVGFAMRRKKSMRAIAQLA
jgi:PEP-CTERM motif-containing protein